MKFKSFRHHLNIAFMGPLPDENETRGEIAPFSFWNGNRNGGKSHSIDGAMIWD